MTNQYKIEIRNANMELLSVLMCKNEEIFRQDLAFLMEHPTNVEQLHIETKPGSRYLKDELATEARLYLKSEPTKGFRSVNRLVSNLITLHNQNQTLPVPEKLNVVKTLKFESDPKLFNDLRLLHQSGRFYQLTSGLLEERNFQNKPILYISSMSEEEVVVKVYGPSKQTDRLLNTIKNIDLKERVWELLRHA